MPFWRQSESLQPLKPFKNLLFSLVSTMSAKCHPGPLWMSFGCPRHPQIDPMGSKMNPRDLQGAPKTPQMEPKGVKVKPRGVQSEPESSTVSPRASKVSPKASKVSSKSPQGHQTAHKTTRITPHNNKQCTRNMRLFQPTVQRPCSQTILKIVLNDP